VLIYDDDHYYLGSALAELYRSQGKDVILVTPGYEVSSWTTYTLEQRKIQAAVMQAGVLLKTGHVLTGVAPGEAEITCLYSGRKERLSFGAIVLLTAKTPNDQLYRSLEEREADRRDAGIASVTRIGDCLAPATIASAVFAGHDFAVRFQEPHEAVPFVRERILLAPGYRARNEGAPGISAFP
jgi:dimethylamine/trimethylamine dehydrogenase